MPVFTQICCRCNVEKDISEFHIDKRLNIGHKKACKSCISIYKKIYQKNNKEKIAIYNKNYNISHKEEISNYSKNYYINNKKDIIPKHTKYRNKKMKSDSLFNLSFTIRDNINKSFKNKKFNKPMKSEKILGCSFEEFKIYIESLFEPWMNWGNKGNWNGYPTKINHSWDIDHIIPIFTAKTQADIIKLNHYTNLRPLCSYTNRHIKRAKIS